ncbi:dolichol kinase-like [Daphnia carinata]|uniref:dolichol kinase-like n=1 Tax=Daphnia carinata TaxID=120202 RepID=UPI002579C41F|nr:dolichol kinase-like [Daphnia carinata]
MDLSSRMENPASYKLSQHIRLRPGAKAGLWCALILPLSMILSCLKYQELVSRSYVLATASAAMSCIYLFMNLYGTVKSIITHAIVIAMAIYGCLVAGLDLITVIYWTSLLIIINIPSYTLLCKLLERFPCSFSIGEAMLVVQGTSVFVFVTISNCLLNSSNLSTVFCQIVLFSVGIFLLGTDMIPQFQQLLTFSILFLTVIGTLTLPVLFLVLKKNPVVWFLLDFVFLKSTRVYLIIYWFACTLLALIIAWRFGSGSSVKLTVLRKYFHGVIIAVFLPGIFYDVQLLFVASVIILAAFLLLEASRLHNLDYVAELLNKNMIGFLDEKDQGTLILTHIYLLIGCSLPIWIFPLTSATDATDYLLLCSGIISLGIGDTAASIGGTLWGKTKLPGSSKSIEGTICSIMAEVLFILALFYFGMFGVSSHLPWFSFIVSSIVTSLVEACTSQVDNLVLPLVMYIVFII